MAQTHLETTRKYDWADGQAVAISGTTAPSTAIAADEVLLSSTTNVWITVASAPVATKGAASLYLAAGVPLHIQIIPGQKVAGIQDSAAGTLTIIPVL